MAKITWLHSIGGDFATGSNWSGGVVPGASDDALLTASGTYTVTSAQNETVNSVQINQAVTLSITGATFNAINGSGSGQDNGVIAIGNNTEFEAGGTIAGTGTIQVNSAGNGTYFVIDASSLTLSGGGALVLNGSASNVVEGASAADVMINVNDTISGGGLLGNGEMSLSNGAAGVVNANSTSQMTMNISGSGSTGVTNAGLIEATGTGGLYIVNTGIVQTGTGTIKAIGANVDVTLNNVTIAGGTLTTATNGLIQDVNIATLDSVTITAGSTVADQNNSYMYLNNTITNKGTIALNSAGNGTNLYINTATVTLTGAGKVVMSNNGANQILAAAAGNKLVNVNNTISGGGNFAVGYMAFDNQAAGILNANDATAMQINPGGQSFTNEGLVEDTGTGGMIFNQVDIVNTGTVAAIGAGTSVQLGVATISGGTLKTSGGGVIESVNNSTLDGATNGAIKIASGSQIVDLNNEYLTLLGTINNLGTISVDSSGNGTDLFIGSSAVTLTGAGSVVLTDNGANQIFASTNGYELINVNNTISGSGNFAYGYMAFNNEAAGILNSNGSAGLQINNGYNLFMNEGLIEDTGTGGITINNTTIANSGTIEAVGKNTSINLGGNATIQGGTIATSNGGIIQSTNTGTLDGATKGAITIATGTQIVDDNNEYLFLDGTIDNLGTISLNSVGNGTDLFANSPTVTLTGGGSVLMSDSTANAISAASSGYELVNVNNIISGSGGIAYNYLVFDNQAAGIIDSTGATGMNIQDGGEAFTNEGLIEDTGAGGLGITASTIVNTGTIGAFGAGTSISLSNGVIQGGTVSTTGGGIIQSVNSGVLDGATAGQITITKGSQIAALNNTGLYLDGTINNLGTISLNSIGNGTVLYINTGTVMLTGGGSVLMSDNAANEIYASNAGNKLINVNNVISGSGGIAYGFLAFDNQAQGVLDSSGAAGMTINNGQVSFTNEGLVEDTGAGGLGIVSSTITNTGTVGAFGAGTSISLSNGTLQGGVIATSGGGIIQSVNSGVLDGATAGTLTIASGSTVAALNNTALYLEGSIVNHGTLAIDSTGNGTVLYIATGTVTLSGAGQVILADTSASQIYATASGNTLVNVNNTISGAGGFAYGYMNFINQTGGTLDANGANQLNVNPGGNTFNNAGLVESTGAGGLFIQAAAVTNSGTFAAYSGGGITLNSNDSISNLANGTLTGGTWEAIAANGTAATLALNTGSITADKAHLVISGVGASITDNGTLVSTTLTSIGVTGEIDILNNASYTTTNALTVYGQIKLAGTLTAAGITGQVGSVITATGPAAIATTGRLGVAGTLQATSGGTLALSGAALNNTGTVVAQAGGIINVNEKITQLVGGTLTGGSWSAIGNGATLNLAAAAVTTDAANITLSGVGSVIKDGTGGKKLEGTLASIAATGTLAVLGNRAFASTNATGLADAGTVLLGGGTFSDVSLTIASGGTFSGGGTITGAVTDSGTLLATTVPTGSTGALTVTGAVTGTGLIDAAAASNLMLTAGFNVGTLIVAAGGTIAGAGAVSGAVTDAGVLTVGATGSLSAGSITIQAGGALSAGSVTATGAITDNANLTFQGGTLSGSSLTVGAASAVLLGFGTVAQSVANSGTIEAQGGTLTLSAGETGGTVKADASATLVGNGINASSATIAAGGDFIAYGAVTGATTDSGLITASGGTLVLANVTGTGSASIATGATLQSTGALAVAGVSFTGVTETLALGTPSGNTAAISGFAAGNTIDVLSTTVTAFTFNATTDTMTLKHQGTIIGSLKFIGSYTSANFALKTDGHTGTNISFVASPANADPLADLQSAAAATAPASAGSHFTASGGGVAPAASGSFIATSTVSAPPALLGSSFTSHQAQAGAAAIALPHVSVQ